MDDLQKLYGAVSAKFNIGTYDQFAAKMQTPEDRKKFYDAVGSKGFDLGDYGMYESRLSGTGTSEVKKNESSNVPSDSGASQSPSSVPEGGFTSLSAGLEYAKKQGANPPTLTTEELNQQKTAQATPQKEVVPQDVQQKAEEAKARPIDKTNPEYFQREYLWQSNQLPEFKGLDETSKLQLARQNPGQYDILYDIKDPSKDAVILTKEKSQELINDILGTLSHRLEFKDKNWKDLTDDQKRVVMYEFNKRFIPEESLKKYMADNNMNLDLSGGGHALRSLDKSFFNTLGSTIESVEILSEQAAGKGIINEARSLEAKARVGALTKKEYESMRADLEKRIQSEKSKPIDERIALTTENLGGKYKDPLENFKVMTYDEAISSQSPESTRYLSGAVKGFEGVGVGDYNIQEYNPKYSNSFFLDKLPSGVGSMAAFMVGGENPITIATLGGLSNASTLYNEAIDNGATSNDAMKAFTAGLGIGATEAIPMERFFNRLNKATAGALSQRIRTMASQGLEEGFQEFMQGALNNLTAQQLYDETREIINDGTLSDAFVGLTLGSIMGIAATRTGGSPQDQKAIANTIDLISEKTKQNATDNTTTAEGGGKEPVTTTTEGTTTETTRPSEQPVAETVAEVNTAPKGETPVETQTVTAYRAGGEGNFYAENKAYPEKMGKGEVSEHKIELKNPIDLDQWNKKYEELGGKPMIKNEPLFQMHQDNIKDGWMVPLLIAEKQVGKEFVDDFKSALEQSGSIIGRDMGYLNEGKVYYIKPEIKEAPKTEVSATPEKQTKVESTSVESTSVEPVESTSIDSKKVKETFDNIADKYSEMASMKPAEARKKMSEINDTLKENPHAEFIFKNWNRLKKSLKFETIGDCP